MIRSEVRIHLAIPKITAEGERGTGVLVGDDLVLTALHVVASWSGGADAPRFRQAPIRLTFHNYGCDACVIPGGWDIRDDWVVLRCLERPPLKPLPLYELTESPVNWWTHGFPNRQPIDGMTYDGRVVDHQARLEGVTALQLFSEQVAAEHPIDNDSRNPVGGLSGAPVIVDGSVVGLIRFALGAGHPQAGTLYATPIGSILASERASIIPASDPYIGLPPLPPMDPPEQPFQYLSQYQRKDAPVFFGRGWEIRSVYDALTAPPNDSPPVIFLIGQSGVGKSSLLAAGVLPRLEQEGEVFYFRRSTELSLPAGFKEALNSRTWVEVERQSGRAHYIMLDQAEDVFLQGGEHPDRELREFMQQVRDVFGELGSRPRGRLVLGFRKEWLQEWDRVFREFAVPRRVIRVDPLTQQGIREVVLGLESTERLKRYYRVKRIDATLATKLVERLSHDKEANISPILQIWMTELWSDSVQRSDDSRCLTLDRFETLNLERLTIAKFLDQQLQKIDTKFSEYLSSGLIIDMLAAHVSPNGDPRTLSADAKARLYMSRGPRDLAVLSEIETELRRVGILIEPSGGDASRGDTRLVHDTLIPEVLELFHRSGRPGQRARRVLEVRAAEWTGGQTGSALDDHDLELVEAGRQGMRDLTCDEERLVDKSRKEFGKRRLRRRLLYAAAAASVAVIVGFAVLTMFARATAENAYAASTSELVNSLLELGFASLRTDPALSLRLALSVYDLTQSERPAGLLKASIEKVPVWCTVAPEGFAPQRTGILTKYPSPMDPFVADRELNWVLMPERTQKSEDIAVPGQHLALREIPSGKTLASLILGSKEVLINPGGQTSEVAIVRAGLTDPWGARVYLLNPTGLESPIWLGDGIRDIATSAGSWPLFVLKDDGTLIRLVLEADHQHVSETTIGLWRGSRNLVVHPSGNAVLLMSEGQLEWIRLDSTGTVAEQRPIEMGSVLPITAAGGLAEYAKFGWGSNLEDILMLEVRNEGDKKRDITLYAIDAETGDRFVIRQYTAKIFLKDIEQQIFSNPLDRPGSPQQDAHTGTELSKGLIDNAKYFFVTNSAGTRVAITHPDDRSGTQTEVFDLDWRRSENHLEIKMSQHYGNILIGKTSPGKALTVNAIALSPNDRYAIIASFLKDEDIQGVGFDGVGVLEQWGVFALKDPQDVPKDIELITDPISTDIGRLEQWGVVAASAPNDVRHIKAPESDETGMTQIIRVVYSRDGGRVAALHEDGQVNVFRVPAGGHPGSIFDTWSARLMEPEVHSYGPGNRYALLKYRDGEQHFYDFKEGREVNFGPIFADGGVLGEDWIDERSSLVIATAKTLFELSESGELNEKIAFPIVAEEVWVGDHLAYVVSAKRAYFYSIPDFKPIGSLDMIDDTKEFFVSSKKGLDFEVLDTGALGETPVTSLLNPPNAHTNSSKSYFTVARSKDWLETWILQQAESPGDLLAMANPKKIPIPSADWIDYSVTLDPPTIWINTGTYPRMNTTTSTTLSQADPFSGNVISRYQPPAAGWPETLWQVKTAFAVDNDRVAIFRYGQSDASSNSYIAGIWDRMGGQPKAWSKLGDSDVRYSNHVGQPEIKKNGEIAYVTLECEGRVDLVRLSDGSILMHKEIPSDVPLYPFLDISRRDVSNRVSNKFYDLIYRDAMARGVKFWSNVTTKKLPEALVRRLDEARARLH